LIGLLQRVREAWVEVDSRRIAAIETGLLVLVGVERGDGQSQADRLLQRLLGYRVFADQQGRMNRSLMDIGGSLLLVPQFTLAADTNKGTRPGFSTAADPVDAKHWFEYLLDQADQLHAPVVGGVFGADMQVGLVNDGPVTFWLQT
jgi:D-tyrosyl-tRNA(Tyr) deacylase